MCLLNSACLNSNSIIFPKPTSLLDYPLLVNGSSSSRAETLESPLLSRSFTPCFVFLLCLIKHWSLPMAPDIFLAHFACFHSHVCHPGLVDRMLLIWDMEILFQSSSPPPVSLYTIVYSAATMSSQSRVLMTSPPIANLM